jgi:hypothetical protein
MDPNQTIKQAAALAEPFSAATFAQVVGTDEESARIHLGELMGMDWVTEDNSSGVTVYRLTEGGRYRVALPNP